MTHDLPPEAPVGAPPTPAAVATTNTVGRIALGVAIAGFIFACIPGALIIGWVLLPVAFILGIVGATRTGQRKGGSIAAIIISIVGVIVGVVVFLAVVAGAVDEAFDAATGGETTAIDSDEAAPDAAADEDGATDDAANAADEAADDETADDAAAGPAGTREDPFPFDSVIANNEWSVELSGFDADADEEIAAASQVNDAPGEGYRWVTVDAAATYVGAASGNVLEVSVDYVAADGTVISAHDEFVMGLEPEFDSLAELYEGATEDGKLAFLVPDAVDGEFRVTLGILADEVFVALPAQ